MHNLRTMQQTGAGHELPAILASIPFPQPDFPTTPHPPQQLLFPSTPRTVCEEIGLNWWAALKLHEDGWLSFSPESTTGMDESQEAELRFVGALVVAGCDRPMLASLLSTLPRPYAYHRSRLYYDWPARRWRVLPDPMADPEATFTEWLEVLVEKRDGRSLAGIAELAQDALARVRAQSGQQELGVRS